MISLAALLLTATGTFAFRSASVRAFRSRTLSPVATRMLRHGALAVLGSLVVTNLPRASGSTVSLLPNIAGLTASVLVARRTSNPATIIAAGVALYAVLHALMRS